jgi:predicted dehydrogenase
MAVKLAFAGTGWIANVHARAAALLPHVELSAAVNHRPESLHSFSQEFGIPRAHLHLEDLIAAGGVDALVISTPNALHAPQTIAALKKGIHVLVEKPMALNAAQAQEMCEASRTSGALLMLAHNWRFHEEVIWLREQIRQQRIGRVIRTQGVSVHSDWGPTGWFLDRELAGGGALIDMGVHAIDTARFLLGDPLPKSVYAKIGTHYISAGVDDTAELVITWTDGAYSHIQAGWWQPQSSTAEALAGVYGAQGFGSVLPTRLNIRRPDGLSDTVDAGFAFPRSQESVRKMYESQMAHFIQCVELHAQPSPGGREGLINMQIIDAAWQSARTGKVINI